MNILKCIAFAIGMYAVAIGLVYLGQSGLIGQICGTAIILGVPIYLGWRHRNR